MSATSSVPAIEQNREAAKTAMGNFFQELTIYSKPIDFGASGDVFKDEELGDAISKDVYVGEKRIKLQLAASLGDVTPGVILRYKKPINDTGTLESMELLRTTNAGKARTELRLKPGRGAGGVYKLILESDKVKPILNEFVQDHSVDNIPLILEGTQRAMEEKKSLQSDPMLGESTMNRVFGDSLADIAGALEKLNLTANDAITITSVLIDLINTNAHFNANDFLRMYAA